MYKSEKESVIVLPITIAQENLNLPVIYQAQKQRFAYNIFSYVMNQKLVYNTTLITLEITVFPTHSSN